MGACFIEGKPTRNPTNIDTGCDLNFDADGEQWIVGTSADLNMVDQTESMNSL
jgi:hypothetical protein